MDVRKFTKIARKIRQDTIKSTQSSGYYYLRRHEVQFKFFLQRLEIGGNKISMLNFGADKVVKMTETQTFQKWRSTRLALLWMNLAAEPLISLYTLIPFILRKDLSATMFQVSLFVTLRPVLSVFSFYWSAYLKEKTESRPLS